MTLKNSILFWLILLVLLAAAPAVRAALTELPESSYYQGQTYYDTALGPGEILTGRIEFAVYDTLVYPDEFTGPTPGDGRYIYAYQIFNDAGAAAVSHFTIGVFGEGAIPADSPSGHIGTDDSASGVDATNAYFNPDLTLGNWAFDGGILVAEENSVFLLVSSDGDMKTGSYTFSKPDDDIVVPGEDDGDTTVPEPATMLLLTVGSMLSFRKTKSV